MIKNKEQRVGVFVDVSNLYYSARHYGARVNFDNLLKVAVAGKNLKFFFFDFKAHFI